MASAAARVRACRERKRRGRRMLKVEIDAALPSALTDAGFLQAWDEEDDDAVAAAIAKVLAELLRDHS